MNKSTNFICRMLMALLLCAGVLVTSCEGEGPLGEENTEQGSGDDNGGGGNDEGGENGGGEGNDGESDGNAGTSGAMTWSLDKVTEVSATFSGTLAVAASDLAFSQVTVYCSDVEPFNINGDNTKKTSTAAFDSDQKFVITVTGLKPNMKYNYCLVAEVKSEKTYGDVKDFTTISLVAPTLNAASDITYESATISGKVNPPSKIGTGLEYGFQYCASEDFLSDVISKKITDIDSANKFSFQITDLVSGTTYYYRSYVKMNGATVYGEPQSFKTQPHPSDVQSDLNVSLATDLSSSGSANCYIVSDSGLYKFKAVKGNNNESVGSVVSAAMLWETFGTSSIPEMFDLIKAFCYKDGYIAFQTADTFKEGNAVIAAKDAEGNILWSWHIWLTDQPQEQVYYNNAGTMMDRNLGATSARRGDVGALGLLYQWGRKDPFLGSSSIEHLASYEQRIAKSTINWPSSVSSNSSSGTIEYATANPTTFITYNSSNYDWYYTGNSNTNNTRWTTSSRAKSIYDPCPSGWRVPDGGSNGVWSTANGSSSSFDYTWSRGMDFSSKFGEASSIWYPASGFRSKSDGVLSGISAFGHYWSASSDSYGAYCLSYDFSDSVDPSCCIISRALGYSVRCVRESK